MGTYLSANNWGWCQCAAERNGVNQKERDDVRDGGDERAVGGEVASGGKDVRALDESGLYWG